MVMIFNDQALWLFILLRGYLAVFSNCKANGQFLVRIVLCFLTVMLSSYHRSGCGCCDKVIIRMGVTYYFPFLTSNLACPFFDFLPRLLLDTFSYS